MKKLLLSVSLLALTAPVAAFAQTTPDPYNVIPLGNPIPEGAPGILKVIDSVTNWMFTIFMAVAVIFILYAAWKYLIGQGEGEEVTKSHKMLVYAGVAIAVAVLSKGLVNAAKLIVSQPNAAGGNSAPPPTGNSGGGGGASNSPVTVATSPNTVAVYPCQPSGIVPVVRVDGQVYGNAAGKTLVGVNSANPQITVERCADGTVPYVLVNGQRYPQAGGGGN